MRPVVTDQYRGFSVGRSVCHSSEPCKTDQDVIWVEDSDEPNHVLDGGPDPSIGRGIFKGRGKEAAHCKV